MQPLSGTSLELTTKWYSSPTIKLRDPTGLLIGTSSNQSDTAFPCESRSRRYKCSRRGICSYKCHSLGICGKISASCALEACRIPVQFHRTLNTHIRLSSMVIPKPVHLFLRKNMANHILICGICGKRRNTKGEHQGHRICY